ncbi:heterokaryon incompatibility protein-domain-containing protein [Paraphoma chrysanthemicola]|uniref:Heterokaryon incompatibility protein-domain-containing protein n=1 Tax=Paraphoma chrysanthemicola TaxID=798071 RepID=A0A8K0QWD2_9PLEO|nr:heterokaryon incompatibility protein-domain-containing protein [Paraphoma chrysanthemicola]
MSTVKDLARRAKKRLRSLKGSQSLEVPISTEGAEGSNLMPEEFCASCRELSIEMQKAIAWRTTGRESKCLVFTPRTMYPGSECALCNFLGFMSGPFKNLIGGDMHELEVLLEFQEEDAAYTFSPGLFFVYLQQHGSSDDLVKYRTLIPVLETRIAAEPAPPYRPLRPVTMDFDLFRAWISHCAQTHDDLCSLSSGSLPSVPNFKLIDCETTQVVEGSLSWRYVALSYVWGSTSAGLAQISSGSFPKTVQDSMIVARELGFKYIWVDKYCIDQGNAVEVHQQVSRMNSIYRCANLTIIAAAGAGSQYGLPGVQPGSRDPQPRLVMHGTTWVSVLSHPGRVVRESKWSKRAWTYQEGFFSRRRLIFTEEQVIFQCNSASCCELSDPDPNAALYSGLLDQSTNMIGQHYMDSIPWGKDLFRSREVVITYPENDWLLLDRIEEYSHRELSFQEDALNAVGGLFASLNKHGAHAPVGALTAMAPYQYWGIPLGLFAYMHTTEQPDLEKTIRDLTEEEKLYAVLGCGLSWILKELGFGQVPSAIRREGFPSWSWAGWIAPVTWRKVLSLKWLRRDIPAAIWVYTIDHRYERLTTAVVYNLLSANAPEASLYTGRLAVEADIIDVNLGYFPDILLGVFAVVADVDTRSNPYHELESCQLVWPVRLTVNGEEGTTLHTFLWTARLHCLVMFGHYGLIVRTNDGVSERLGIVELDARGLMSKWKESSYCGFEEWDGWSPPHKERCLAKRFPIRKGRVLLE